MRDDQATLMGGASLQPTLSIVPGLEGGDTAARRVCVDCGRARGNRLFSRRCQECVVAACIPSWSAEREAHFARWCREWDRFLTTHPRPSDDAEPEAWFVWTSLVGGINRLLESELQLQREQRPAPELTMLRGGDPRRRLRGLLATVLDAQQGERNQKLFWAACRAGEMIVNGELDVTTAVGALQDAAAVAGLTVVETGDATRGTIGSRLRKAGVVT